MADYKNTDAPVGANERADSIKLSHTTLRSVVGNSGTKGLESALATAPAFHQAALPRVMSEAEAQTKFDQLRAAGKIPSKASATTAGSSTVAPKSKLTRGTLAWDRQKQQKVVVIKADVARTPKGTPIHKVSCAATDEVYLQSEKRLEER